MSETNNNPNCKNNNLNNINESVNLNFIKNASNPLKLELTIENKKIEFEIDSGACTSVISNNDYLKYFKNCKMYKVENSLEAVTGQEVKVIGLIKVNVRYYSYEKENQVLELMVIESNKNFTPLCGRPWLDYLYPNWRDFFVSNNKIKNCYESCFNKSSNNIDCNDINELNVNHAIKEKVVGELLVRYSKVFCSNLEEPIKNFVAEIHMKKEAVPKFFKPYTVPYGLRDQVWGNWTDYVTKKLLNQSNIVIMHHQSL